MNDVIPVFSAWMWSKVGHYGLDESTNDANDPDDGVRIGPQEIGVKRFTLTFSQDDEEGSKGGYDSQPHATLVKSEPEILLQRFDRFPCLLVIPKIFIFCKS